MQLEHTRSHAVNIAACGAQRKQVVGGFAYDAVIIEIMTTVRWQLSQGQGPSGTSRYSQGI